MAPPALYRFRDFDLDVAGYRLSRNGRPVRIERQPMDLLILLVANRQRLVTRAEIDPERVNVVGRTSMMVYKRTTKSLATIGRELGADYLVESST